MPLKDLAKSISLNPGYWFNYLTCGYYYYDIGQDDKAIADFTEGIRLNLEKADIYYMRGLAYNLGRKILMMPIMITLQPLLTLNPKSGNYWLNRSQVDKALGKNYRGRQKRDAMRAKQLGGIADIDMIVKDESHLVSP